MTHPTTDLSNAVDIHISNAQLRQLSHGIADPLIVSHRHDPGAHGNPAAERLPDVGQRPVVAPAPSDGIVLLRVGRVVAGRQSDARRFEDPPEMLRNVHEVREDLDLIPSPSA
jgi:hypothetical protein